MPVIDFSARDILRSKVVEPAWYRVRVDTVGEAPSKDGNSINWTLEGTILFNADTGDKANEGVPTPYWNFNSKAKGFMIPFFQAISGTEVTPGARYELRNAEGKELDVFIENKEYDGRMVNNMNHKYRAPRA